MYQLLLNLWIMRRITEERLQAAVTKRYISQEQADNIVATPQVAG